MLKELNDYYEENGDDKNENELKQELFLVGGIELLFRLEENRLEVFGGFLHEKDMEINVFNFKAVTLAELQEIFTDYR